MHNFIKLNFGEKACSANREQETFAYLVSANIVDVLFLSRTLGGNPALANKKTKRNHDFIENRAIPSGGSHKLSI